MATTEFTAAIELSSSRLSAIAGKTNADGSIQVLAYAEEDATPFIHKGVIYNIDKTAQALRTVIGKLEDQLESSIAKVYVGIGGQSLQTVKNMVSRTLNEESVISQELVDSIGDENRQASLPEMNILDVAPQEYHIDNGLHADPVGVTGKHIIGQFLNIVARNSLKKNVELSFEQAQLPVAELLVAPVVLAHAVLSDNEMRSGCALVDFGADTTTVSVYKNNLLRYLCVIPLGGNNITRDIATLQIEEEEAEQLKCQYGDARQDIYEENEDNVPYITLEDGRDIELSRLNTIVGARTEEILANVWNQLQLSGYENQLYAGVVFTGGTSNLKNLEEAFRHVQDKITKVKTMPFVNFTVHGFKDQLKSDGRQNTLLGLLAIGHENCCMPKQKPVIEPPVTDEFGQTRLGFDDNDIRIEPPKPKPDQPSNPVTEPVETGKEKKNKKKGWRTLFENWAGEILEDNSDKLDNNRSNQ